MTSWSITNFLLILPILLDSSNTSLIESIATWNIIGSSIVPAVFILFVDSFEGKIDPKKVAVSFTTLGGVFFLALSGISSNIELSSTIVVVEGLTTMRWSPLTSLAIFPTVLLCGYWTQKELIAASRHAFDKRQIFQIRYMRIGGILMFFVGPIWGILGVILVDGLDQDVLGTWSSEIVGYLFVSIGIFMIVIAYTRAKQISFLQPQRIDTLLVIHGTGIPIAQHDFHPEAKLGSELTLVSGAVTAISALMKEAFNVSSNIRSFAFFDKELLLEFRRTSDGEQEIGFILISERGSQYLLDGLNRFAETFMKKFEPSLTIGSALNQQELELMDRDIKIAFGFES